MPELPEVETIRLGLQKYIVGVKPRSGHATIRGKTIENVEVRLKKIVSGDTKNIIGGKVVDVRRFGKGLVIDLDNNYSIAIHIKLTGQLIYRGGDVPKDLHQSIKVGGELPNKFTHVIFKLNKGSILYYNDLRQFGWIKIVKTEDIKNLPFFKELGPEFLSNLTMKQFNNIVSSSNTPIKPLLMDQKKMSGVGNIYANDALFEARIDPRRKAKDLSGNEIKRLYNAILKVLKMGLEYGGASDLSFVNALGQEGGYQNHFLVYGRKKEPCRVCKSPIQKIKLGGRGTYFCSKCQR